MQIIKIILISFIVSLITCIGTLYYYHRHYEPRIIAVNLNSFLKKQERAFVNGQITKQQLQERINEAVSFIKSQPKNTVVLTGNCVLRGKVVNIRSR